MKKVIMNVMMITIIAKILGFLREVLLSYFLGATGISDAYLISLTIPGTIFQFVGTGLATCFIPVFMGIAGNRGKEAANRYTNSVLSLILIFSLVVIIAVWFFGDIVVKIFASGFEGDTFTYAVLFTKINIISLIISTFVYVFNSFLQSSDCFTPTAFAAIPNSLMIMLSIVLGARVNILLLPVGSVAAVMTQLIVLIPFVRKKEFRLRLNVDFKSPDMRQMYTLILPVIIGVSVNEINVIIDKTVASNVAEGGISALSYAYSLIMFVQGIFAQTIASVYYPEITKLAERKEDAQLKKTISEAIEGMIFLLLPIMVGCILLASEVVSILYGRGAFDSNAIQLTSMALMGYAVGIVGYGVREVFSRIFYAIHDTKTPTFNAMIGMIINIVLNITLSRFIGVVGLALATSISSIVTSLLLLNDLRKRKIYVIDQNLKGNLVKILISSVVMGGVLLLAMVLISWNNIYMKFIINVLLGVAVYFAMAYMLKINIITELSGIVKRKIKG